MQSVPLCPFVDSTASEALSSALQACVMSVDVASVWLAAPVS